MKDLDVDKAAADYHTDFDWGELFERAVAPLLFGIGATPDEFGCFGVGWIMENFSPWAVLRLLADNPANLRRPVEWAFADVVEGGWVEEEDIIASLRAPRKFLIVTEGSSDSMVLRKALQLLRPEVEDFFSFVDMERGYPFTGSGNMVKFCQGLVNIGIENQIIAVFDNDAEGVAGQAALRRLNLPINLRATCLPDLDELREMDTSGPQGHSRTDINGRAASIECYLDFASVGSHPPRVRWSSFNATAGVYQGELEDKQSYVRQFLSATVDSLRSGYDCSKLGAALDSIIRECVGIAEAQKCSAGGR
ncbi:MAG: HEPN/Toprim-associated domain-containing protein [Dehalococcoidia bacterium]